MNRRRFSRSIHLLGHIACFTFGVLLATAAPAQEPVYADNPLSHWIDRLANGNRAEKRLAALAMGSTTPQREDVVDLLLAALRQSDDYELRIIATNALKQIGPFAKKAVPDLIAGLTSPDWSDNSLREQAAAALAMISAETPLALVERLEVERNEAIIYGLLRAIGYLRTSDPRAVRAVIGVLERLGDTLDQLYEIAVLAIDLIDEPVPSILIEELARAKNPVVRYGIMAALGRIYLTADGHIPPKRIIDALLAQTADLADEDNTRRAFAALTTMAARTDDVRLRLAALLTLSDISDTLLGAAATTASKLFPKRADLAALTVKWLPRDDNAQGYVIEASIAFGKVAIPEVLAALTPGAPLALRRNATKVLGRIGHSSPKIVSVLTTHLNHLDAELREVTIEALGQLPPHALAAIPSLAALLDGASEDTAAHILESITALVTYGLGHPLPDIDTQMTDMEASLTRVLEKARTLAAAAGAAAEAAAGTVQPITRVLQNIQQSRQRRIAIVGASVLGAFLVLGGIVAVSIPLQRRMRVILGQRWTFAVGQTDFVARVTEYRDERRVAVAPRAEGLSAMLETTLPKAAWPPPADMLAPLQTYVGTAATVRVEVDEGSFAQPWSQLIAGSWIDAERRNVAGQICLTPRLAVPRPHYARRLHFAGLASGGDDGAHGSLPMAEAEVRTAAAVFDAWAGGRTTVVDQATKADLSAAIAGADVVHVAAHATFDRILLADGAFSVADLSSIDLPACRCRLLILGACEAGDIRQPHAFLWDIVRAGINVIAARQPVHDHVCSIFFEELYRALLPGRRSADIELAEAIRRAVASSRRRLEDAGAGGTQDSVTRLLEQNIGVLVLFGDPTLNLRMVFPRKAT